MQVTFNETIDIYILNSDECYTRLTSGTVNGRLIGSTWLSMPLDRAIELHKLLEIAIEDGKNKLNAKIKAGE